MIQPLCLGWKDQDILGREIEWEPTEVTAAAAEEQAGALIIVAKVGLKGRNSSSSRHSSARFPASSRAGVSDLQDAPGASSHIIVKQFERLWHGGETERCWIAQISTPLSF